MSVRLPSWGPGTSDGDADEDVVIPAGLVTIEGHLTVPTGARESSSSRTAAAAVATARATATSPSLLHEAGLGTLLIDLLTTTEERTARTSSTSSCSPGV